MTRIQRLREQKGITQKVLAEASGVNVRTIGVIERGAGGKAQARIRTGIAAALFVTPEAIWTKGGTAR